MSGVVGNNALRVIDSIAQFINGTQAVWNSITIPIPAGLVVYATDTTAVKLGDGVTLYADLPTLFLVNSITSLTQSAATALSDANALTSQFNTLSGEYTTLQASLTALEATVGGLNNTSLSSEITTLTNDYNTLQTTVTALQTSVNNLNNTTLASEIATLTTEYNTLLTNYTAVQNSVTALTTTVNGITNTIAPYAQDISTINSEISALQTAIAAFQPSLYALLNGSANNTFNVGLAANLTQAPQYGQILGGPSANGVPATINDVTTSRTSGVVYTNTKGKPIMVWIHCNWPGGAYGIVGFVNGTILCEFGTNYSFNNESNDGTVILIVPPGATYELGLSYANITTWKEYF